jgi:adenine-specific DNA methylase
VPTYYSETDEDDEIIILQPVEDERPIEDEKDMAPTPPISAILGENENSASIITVSSFLFAMATLLTLVIF